MAVYWPASQPSNIDWPKQKINISISVDWQTLPKSAHEIYIYDVILYKVYSSYNLAVQNHFVEHKYLFHTNNLESLVNKTRSDTNSRRHSVVLPFQNFDITSTVGSTTRTWTTQRTFYPYWSNHSRIVCEQNKSADSISMNILL